MNLWAISDIHIGSDVNRRAVAALTPRPKDWLILAGDVGDRHPDRAENRHRELYAGRRRHVLDDDHRELGRRDRKSVV